MNLLVESRKAQPRFQHQLCYQPKLWIDRQSPYLIRFIRGSKVFFLVVHYNTTINNSTLHCFQIMLRCIVFNTMKKYFVSLHKHNYSIANFVLLYFFTLCEKTRRALFHAKEDTQTVVRLRFRLEQNSHVELSLSFFFLICPSRAGLQFQTIFPLYFLGFSQPKMYINPTRIKFLGYCKIFTIYLYWFHPSLFSRYRDVQDQTSFAFILYCIIICRNKRKLKTGYLLTEI